MFETIIIIFIKYYVARYIDINVNQLSAQIFYKPKIVLKDLTLNKSILNKDVYRLLAIPIQFESIHIDKIEISFLFSSLFLRSKSPIFAISIENVDVILQEIDEKQLTEMKYNQFEFLEAQNQFKLSNSNIQEIFLKLLPKLKFDMKNINILYKNIKSSRNPYAIGFNCQNIEITNKLCEKNLNRQLFKITNPNIYIDTNTSSTHSHIFSHPNSIDIYVDYHQCLFDKYELEFIIDSFNVTLTNENYRILNEIIYSIEYMKYRRTLNFNYDRPCLNPTKESVKQWWRYAAIRILRKKLHSKHLWFDRMKLFNNLRRLVKYKQYCLKYIENKYNITNIPLDEQYQLNDIECHHDYEQMSILHQLIMQKFKLNKNTNFIQKSLTNLTRRLLSLNETKSLSANINKISLIFMIKFVEINLLSLNSNIHLQLSLKRFLLTNHFQINDQSIDLSAQFDEFSFDDRKHFVQLVQSKPLHQHNEQHSLPFCKFILYKYMNSKYSIDIHFSSIVFNYPINLIYSHVSSLNLHKIRSATSMNYENKTIFHVNINIDPSVLQLQLPFDEILTIEFDSFKLTNDVLRRKRDFKQLSGQTAFIEYDNDEFETALTSPIAMDGQLPNETESYVINIVSDDNPIQYKTFSLLIENININHSIEHLKITEKFNIYFDIEYPSMNVSSEIENIYFHVNLKHVTRLISLINFYLPSIKTISIGNYIYYKFYLCLNEVHVLLNDDHENFCDLSMKNIDLLLHNSQNCNNVLLKLENFNVLNCIQSRKNDLLMRITLNNNLHLPFIQLQGNFSKEISIDEYHIIVYINAKNIDFIYDYLLIYKLVECFCKFELIYLINQMLINGSIPCKVNVMVECVSVYNLNSLCMLLENFMINIFHKLFTKLELSIGAIQILNTVEDEEQLRNIIIDIGHDLIKNGNYPFSLLFTTSNNNLSINISNISYFYSLDVMLLQKILDYIENQPNIIVNVITNVIMILFNQFKTSIEINRIIMKFTTNLALNIEHLILRNDDEHLSKYQIYLQQMNFLWVDSNLSLTFLENLRILPTIQTVNQSFKVHFQTTFPMQLYLSQKRIDFIRNIIAILNQYGISLLKLTFNFQSSDMVIFFMIDRNDQSITISRGLLNSCQFFYEQNSSHRRRLSIQFHSLHINYVSLDTEQCLIQLKSPSLFKIYVTHDTDYHKKIDMNLGSTDVKLIKPTWNLLSEILHILTNRTSASNYCVKNEILGYLTEFSFVIDSLLCSIQDEVMNLVNIDLNRLIFRSKFNSNNDCLQSSTMTGQLGFLSITDLSVNNQLYVERIRTSNSDSLAFEFCNEKNNISQIKIQLTSFQYIHTDDVLHRIFSYLKRFQQNEYFYFQCQSLIPTEYFKKIHFSIQLNNFYFILPESLLEKSSLIFEIHSIEINNLNSNENQLNTSPFHSIILDVKQIELYHGLYHLFTDQTTEYIEFSNFILCRNNHGLPSLVRNKFDFYFDFQYDLLSLIYYIKINLSPMDVLLNIQQINLLKFIFYFHFNENVQSYIINKYNFHTNIHLNFKIERIGFEIFKNQCESLVIASLSDIHLLLDQYANGKQNLNLTCSTIKLIDTRLNTENIIILLPISTSTNRLEINMIDNEFIMNLNCLRFLFIADWLLELNEFISILSTKSNLIPENISNKSFQVLIHLNQFQLVLVSATGDPYANALVYSSSMLIQYKNINGSLEFSISDMTFLTCQIGNIDDTSMSIIDPIDCSLVIHPMNETSNEKICKLDISKLNICLCYSDIRILYFLFESLTKQISNAKTRKPLLNTIGQILTSPLKQSHSSETKLSHIKYFKFICNEIYLCIIDDCCQMNIPLLNINIETFCLQTIENNSLNRIDQNKFNINISYYNRFQSGFEPLIEQCSLEITVKRSSSTKSLSIHSNEILNINYTKALYHLYEMAKINISKYNSIEKQVLKINKMYRQGKQIESYCFKNLVGSEIRFRTWIENEYCYLSDEYIANHNTTVSFTFPSILSHNENKKRANSLVTSLFQTNRRLSITINGWQTLQTISIDRVGTYFRLALPIDSKNSFKPILVIIDIAMTENSVRSIAIRSSVEIQNQLLTSIDIRIETNMNLLHDFSIQSKEIYSLPIEFCSIIKNIYIRPSNFALDYCEEPIQWGQIENNENSNLTMRKNSMPNENKSHYESFLRFCSFNGKECVYHFCLQSKQHLYFHNEDNRFSLYKLSIVAPITICNHLPCLLKFDIASHPQKFQIDPYKVHCAHTINILENININFSTNLYHMKKSFCLPALNDLYQIGDLNQHLSFFDNNERELICNITIISIHKYRLKIILSVPYVFFNKTGIPLILKDANCKYDAAGQYEEDEVAVNREGILFSFEHANNRNNACVMRIGNGLHENQNARPQWSPRFILEHGSTHRQLQVRSNNSSSEWNYSIGIDIHPGKGNLKATKFIFLTARYMISNQCSYDVLIRQQSATDEDLNYVYVPKNSILPYHWSRYDTPQLLSVKIVGHNQYGSSNWSGGFQIENVNSLYINIRYNSGQSLLLRVQTVQRDSTIFVVFMNLNPMPAPFRIVNRSDIPIQFYQTELNYMQTTVLPHQSIDYTWDEPTMKSLITCSIVDGSKSNYDLYKFGYADDLTYHNFIYISFQTTFDCLIDQLLVIDCIDNRLVLAERQNNKRSQLWLMTNNGLLINIGSSSINDSNKRRDSADNFLSRQTFVLDLEDLSDYTMNHLMSRFTSLVLRRYDTKRSFTQTWQFLDSGYLCLANTQLCIQVPGELQPNKAIVLGPLTKTSILLPESMMLIQLHPRYKGSGILHVRILADGPTNVLEIDQVEESELSIRRINSENQPLVYKLELNFPVGVGLSVIGSIGRESEELLYILINNLNAVYHNEDNDMSIEAKIEKFIISNQLLTTTKPCFLYASHTENSSIKPAIYFQTKWKKANVDIISNLFYIIHSLDLHISSITIQLDEILLWKLIDFFDIEISSLSSFLLNSIGFSHSSNLEERKIDININDYETKRMLSLLTSTHVTRIYFKKLYISPIDVNLSIYCVASKRLLSSHLLSLKRHASFPVVPFENAQIHLKSYEQTHVTNTCDCFLSSIINEYVNMSKRQALKIIGAVDYLGNPIGLIQDVTDGLVCLVDQGSVTGLVKNVAHGVANSTSKVTGSLSQGIGKLIPDDGYDEWRQTNTNRQRNSTTLTHAIRHGTAGLAAGFYGGLTSIIKQPYKGIVEEGMPGLVKGFAKGIVGSVSKPVVGILDFTNDMANVIKENSRTTNAVLHNRIRPIRCPSDIFGLLRSYSMDDAEGHYLLYVINKGNMSERFITKLNLSTDENHLTTYAMITTQHVIIYQMNNKPDTSNIEIVNSYDLNTKIKIIPIEDSNESVYIEFLVDAIAERDLNRRSNGIHRCDSSERGLLLHREIQRAQEVFREEKMLYMTSDDENDDVLDNE